jgi:hypothetical protein
MRGCRGPYVNPFLSSLEGLGDRVQLATGGRFVSNYAYGDATFDFALPDLKIAIDFLGDANSRKFDEAKRAGWKVSCFSRHECRSGTACEIVRREIAECRRSQSQD